MLSHLLGEISHINEKNKKNFSKPGNFSDKLLQCQSRAYSSVG